MSPSEILLPVLSNNFTRSEVYRLNNNGDRTQPCFRPTDTDKNLDLIPLILTQPFTPLYKNCIADRNTEIIPMVTSFDQSISLLILS